MAQQVEHVLGKDEVPGSNPGISSKRKAVLTSTAFLLEPVKRSNAPIGAVRGGASHQGSVATAIPVSVYPKTPLFFCPDTGDIRLITRSMRGILTPQVCPYYSQGQTCGSG